VNEKASPASPIDAKNRHSKGKRDNNDIKGP
jgi:hypothetical protein